MFENGSRTPALPPSFGFEALVNVTKNKLFLLRQFDSAVPLFARRRVGYAGHGFATAAAVRWRDERERAGKEISRASESSAFAAAEAESSALRIEPAAVRRKPTTDGGARYFWAITAPWTER